MYIIDSTICIYVNSYMQTQCTHTQIRTFSTYTHLISIHCWISYERDPLIEDNRKINLTLLRVWRGCLLSCCQSRFLQHPHHCVSVFFILWLLPHSHPLSHILCLVVSLLTVWWRHSWKHCLAENPESVCVAQTHGPTVSHTHIYTYVKRGRWTSISVYQPTTSLPL